MPSSAWLLAPCTFSACSASMAMSWGLACLSRSPAVITSPLMRATGVAGLVAGADDDRSAEEARLAPREQAPAAQRRIATGASLRMNMAAKSATPAAQAQDLLPCLAAARHPRSRALSSDHVRAPRAHHLEEQRRLRPRQVLARAQLELRRRRQRPRLFVAGRRPPRLLQPRRRRPRGGLRRRALELPHAHLPLRRLPPRLPDRGLRRRRRRGDDQEREGRPLGQPGPPPPVDHLRRRQAPAPRRGRVPAPRRPRAVLHLE